ncbi:D-sedoheptulose-7-phosphate isomerase [Candidatus Pelagibacter bacterium nBUS_25]|uniref:D-sedoheptulose-7-phosphate isomerase n=1 Tax=Candidatus Pelagibacter bacterium nBUS_25 TaxID=3374187 RepID=UPI0028FAD74B|nr:SIS domain-containing protein [Pelagibacteraceae bacterium]
MKFPHKKYNNVIDYFNDYFLDLKLSLSSINFSNLNKIINVLGKSYLNGDNKVFVCGNGGSAALADHFACDHQKILHETKKYRPFVISLVSNHALGTAISNDVNYKSIFSEQLKQMARKGDILIVISASGKSQNVIEAIKWAKKNKMISISLTGFNGGQAKKISQLNLHIQSKNYGVIEANHQSLINIISQFIKIKALSLKEIQKIKF